MYFVVKTTNIFTVIWDFSQGNQERVRNCRGKRTISVRATEGQLYVLKLYPVISYRQGAVQRLTFIGLFVGWLIWVQRPFQTVFQSISGRHSETEK